MTSKRSVRMVVMLSAAAAVTACARGDAGGDRSMTVDSAGVVVVTNTAGAWVDDQAWRVDTVPSLVIGEVEGATEYLFDQVRSATRLSDSTIVVADGGSTQLRFYDARGRHIRSVGGAGEGPGEFRGISMFDSFAGDSLVVWDFPLRRVSVFAPDGTLARTMNGPQFEEFNYYFRGAFGDGSLLGSLDPGITRETATAGVLRVTSLFFRYSLDGAVDTIGRLFSAESYISMREGMTVMGMPFGRRAVFAAGGDRFHYGSSDAFEIATYGSDGTLQRVVRSTRPPVELPQGEIDAFVKARVEDPRFPARRRQTELLYDEVPFPATLPAYSALLADAAGNIWVQDYMLEPGQPQQWTVFDADGEMLGMVETPAGFTIFEIGADYLLGMQRDDLGVQRVITHRLLKPTDG